MTLERMDNIMSNKNSSVEIKQNIPVLTRVVSMTEFSFCNTIDDIIKQFQVIKYEFSKKQYEDFSITIKTDSECYECGGQYYMFIEAFRKETDEEVKERLKELEDKKNIKRNKKKLKNY